VENSIFLFFFKHLDHFEGCWQACFSAVTQNWITLVCGVGLWITGVLFKNYPQGYATFEN
jgi:type IV secretory pathway TrbD component